MKTNTRKFLTFKSGPFVFSSTVSENKITPLLIEARALYSILEIPIIPSFAAQIEEELIKKSIFGTAAIEGNPLTEEKVNQILSATDQSKAKERADKEIQNLKEAYKILRDFQTDKPFVVDEKTIQEIHRLITADIVYEKNQPGQYRNHLVKVGDENHGGVYIPPKILEDIKNVMSQFLQWINSEEMLSLGKEIRAALAHYYLGLIHPFGDGNGRTARLLEAIILRSYGLKYVPEMLSNFYYRNIDDYFWVFSRSIHSPEHDVTPFVEFFLKGLVESLKDVKETIFYWVRKFTLRDYYLFLRKEKKITDRQYHLLLLLLEDPKQIDAGILQVPPYSGLYGRVSERTLYRDLKKLLDEHLLRVNENGRHSLNFKILD